IEAVGELGADLAPEPTTPNRPRDQLGSLARVVLDLFPAREAIAQVDLDRAAGLIPGALAVVLAELEAASMIRPNGAGWELTARARA
ncbi:MAG: DNA-protecting protein DprA, partial [Actinomycetes bacterium]